MDEHFEKHTVYSFLSLISFHAVVSGWATAASGKLNSFITRWSWVFSAVIVIGSSWGGYRATLSPNGEINDLPAGAFFFISAIAAIIFVLDINYIRSTSGSNMHRISRHLWRMGFAAFLATGIFFFGNNHVLPEVLRTPFKLSLPVLIVIIVTLLFSIKTYRGGFRKRGKIKT